MGPTETRKTPRLAVLVGIAAASVGIIYGYDLSNIAGAMLFIPKEFDLDTAAGKTALSRSVVWLRSLPRRQLSLPVRLDQADHE